MVIHIKILSTTIIIIRAGKFQTRLPSLAMVSMISKKERELNLKAIQIYILSVKNYMFEWVVFLFINRRLDWFSNINTRKISFYVIHLIFILIQYKCEKYWKSWKVFCKSHDSLKQSQTSGTWTNSESCTATNVGTAPPNQVTNIAIAPLLPNQTFIK